MELPERNVVANANCQMVFAIDAAITDELTKNPLSITTARVPNLASNGPASGPIIREKKIKMTLSQGTLSEVQTI